MAMVINPILIEGSNELSPKEKVLNLLVVIGFWLGVALLLVGIAVGVFVFCKCTLNLALPWWSIALSPVWFVLAAIVPGGFLITTAVLGCTQMMLVPWWVWVVSAMTCCLRTHVWLIQHDRIWRI